MLSGIVLCILFIGMTIISSILIPQIKFKTEKAILQREEMLRQKNDIDIRIEKEKEKELGIALYRLFTPDELFDIARDYYKYEIRVNGVMINKNNILFDIKDGRCIVELLETVNEGSCPKEILAEISPFSGKNHTNEPAISVFTTITPYKYNVSSLCRRTIETYLFDDIKVGEIFTVRINHPIVKELLMLGTDVIEITHSQ